ncbi:hypothetical protein HYFRA_00004279 [Hymenoscyphus fraxineus]|uniref:Actin-like ATPase domain-containing protein n=1 Tax=Hymenoscyphus fraxineus TaxID=746836 RepID=A0A9N9KNK7_9HELO|nr:hypothetical protein HYFRA_00004279 [Hymenoscyphus fraxineus]
MAAASSSDRTRHKLIVGIDYGTTFSGVSYVTTDKSGLDDINIVTSWPGEQGTSSKTPTRISYSAENPSITSNKWGFQVHPRLISYSWTKLLLDKNAAVGEHDDPTLSEMLGDGILQLPPFRGAAGVCEDFLREVYTHVSEKFRQEMSAVTFECTPMECWITLPAIWSDEGKDATLNAARKAGFGNRAGDEVFTITEPEAAAIATLRALASTGSLNAIKPNENILICDCGGGTVDITTYVVKQVAPALIFDELQTGTGGKCGSTYVDRNLHSLLSERFGSSFDDVPFLQKGPGSRFMLSFEKCKKDFGSTDDREILEIGPIKLEIPDSDHYDADDRSVLLTYEDMQTLFDPVVAEITSLLSEQVEEAKAKKGARINRLILVGGFAESHYLHNALENWCYMNGEIHLMRPPNPQAAIVRGAALRGLEGLAPRKKYARRHYGMCLGMRFRENVDPETSSYIGRYDDVKRCSTRVKWLISKGDEIMQGTFKEHSFTCDFFPGKELVTHTELYSCSLADAPEYMNSTRVENVGIIRTRLPAEFDFGNAVQSRTKWPTGEVVHQITCQIQIVFGGIGSNLTFRTVVNGMVVSTADIVFDHS